MHLQFEAFYVISLEEIFWGGLLMAITMATHGSGILMVLRVNHYIKMRLGTKTGLFVSLFPVILASCLILLIHLFEVLIWATFFVWKGVFYNQSLSFYFSLNEYTTVGSDVSLPLHWRLLEGLIAITGLLTFAWSTGLLISLAQDFQDQQIALFKRRRKREIGEESKASSSSV